MRYLTPFLLLLTCLCSTLIGAQDPILAQIIQERLSSYPIQATPKEKAAYLSHDIGLIAREAKQKGIDLRRYHKIYATNNGTPCLNSQPVWDGHSAGIPVTFFIYTWPAERIARSINPRSTLYSSNVHKHSTRCAFAILQGTLVQENYTDVPGYTSNVARYEGTNQLKEGDTEIDDLSTNNPFVHRLICRDPQDQICISLHAYGHPSEDQILRSQAEFTHKYVYPSTQTESTHPVVRKKGQYPRPMVLVVPGVPVVLAVPLVLFSLSPSIIANILLPSYDRCVLNAK